MSAAIWLLVEWVQEGNSFPTYGVVNSDYLPYNVNELEPGAVIFIRSRHQTTREAKILRVSGNKHSLIQHRDLLERQDEQVRNVMQICLRTLKEMNFNQATSYFNDFRPRSQNALPNLLVSIPQSSIPQTVHNPNADRAIHFSSDRTTAHYNSMNPPSPIPAPHVMVPRNRNVASDSDSESGSQAERRVQHFNRTAKMLTPHMTHNESRISKVHCMRNRPVSSSTPHPTGNEETNKKQRVTQGTQTDPVVFRPTKEKIEEMETILRNLYSKFQYLVSLSNLNVKANSKSMRIEEVSGNNTVTLSGRSNVANEAQGNAVVPAQVQEVSIAQMYEEMNNFRQMHSSNNGSHTETEDAATPSAPRVRRMSAQTTNNIDSSSVDADLVPIGNGNAKVPKRLLNEINWNSHTAATRQLLQAVFPRRVLATHCLTGKSSPAFMSRPPKKILDPKLVEDIIKIVSTRCNVPKNLVRNSITIKCTDEAKLYRNRMQFKQNREMENDENRAPSTPSTHSSDESTNAVIN